MAGKPGRPPVRWHEGDTIEVVIGHVPKRGTAARRFRLYRTGMTVDEYAEAVIAMGGTRPLALGDLRWDIEKGWVRLRSIT